MPRLNSLGEALMGLGLGEISVDGRVIRPGLVGGRGGWANDFEAVTSDVADPNDQNSPARTVAIHKTTGNIRVLADRAGSEIVAGDNAWAIWDTKHGYLDSFGRSKPAGVSVNDDWQPKDAYGGAIIIKPKYHGPEFRFRWNGFTVEPAAPRESWAWGDVPGRGLCAWPFGDLTHGVVLSGDGFDFEPDLRVMGPRLIRVASSITHGEGPGDLRIYDLDLEANVIRFRPKPDDRRVETRTLVWTDLTQPAPVTVPRIGRGLWVGWFEFDPANTIAPQNCSIVVMQGAPWLMVRQSDGRALCRYVAGNPDGDLDAINRAAAAAIGPLPVMAYWPKPLQQRDTIPSSRIVGIEAYRKSDESIAEFKARLLNAVDLVTAAGKVAALIAQAYTSNATNTADLASIPPVVAEVARDRDVWGVFGFSGSGRATGYQDHPEVHPLWGELVAGITGPGVYLDGVTPQPTPNPGTKEPEHPAPHEDDMRRLTDEEYRVMMVDLPAAFVPAWRAYKLRTEGTESDPTPNDCMAFAYKMFAEGPVENGKWRPLTVAETIAGIGR